MTLVERRRPALTCSEFYRKIRRPDPTPLTSCLSTSRRPQTWAVKRAAHFHSFAMASTTERWRVHWWFVDSIDGSLTFLKIFEFARNWLAFVKALERPIRAHFSSNWRQSIAFEELHNVLVCVTNSSWVTNPKFVSKMRPQSQFNFTASRAKIQRQKFIWPQLIEFYLLFLQRPTLTHTDGIATLWQRWKIVTISQRRENLLRSAGRKWVSHEIGTGKFATFWPLPSTKWMAFGDFVILRFHF